MKKLSDSVIINSPFFVLIASYVLRLLYYLYNAPNYWYDEVLLNSIVNQSTSSVFNILKTELYPPGYFFLARIFLFKNLATTRILSTSIVYAGVLFVLIYVKSLRVYKTKWFFLGLTLFISSFSFLVVSSDLKVELFTIPFSILFFSLFIEIIYNNSASQKQTITLHISMLVCLLLSYTTYSFLLIAYLFLILIIKQRKLIFSFAIQVVAMLTLGYTLVFVQYANAQHRMIWKDYISNSLFGAIKAHVAGTLNLEAVVDVALILYFVLLGFSLFKKSGNRQRHIVYKLVILLIFFTLFSYFMRLFPRPRFVFPFFIVLSFIAGIGIKRVMLTSKAMGVFIIIFLFLVSFLAYFQRYSQFNKYYSSFQYVLREELKKSDGKIGFVSDYSLLPFVIKMGYLQNAKNLKPISLNTKTVLSESSYTSAHSVSDYAVSNTNTRSAKFVKDILSSYKLTRYVYYPALPLLHRNYAHFDYSRTIFRVLIDNCDLTKILYSPISKQLYNMYFFDKCVFDSQL